MSARQIMKRATFNTITDSELRWRNGQTADVIRELTDDDRDAECGPMFEVRFEDGAIIHAFEDELEELA